MSFEFLRHIFERTCEWDVLKWRAFYYRSLARLEFGLAKYKKVMSPGDGRDTVQDAWEESFDLCQYILKAQKEGRGEIYNDLYDRALQMLIDLELEIGRQTLPKD